MPKLTQVKETKRGRYALFFDGEFAFSLDEDTFAMAGLHTGDELEEWQIHDLQTKSDTRKAVDKAMNLLALRDHAAGELYQKLCRSFDPHSAAAAVAKMQELNLLDDAGFARRRAAELLRKRKSRRAILDDLHAKGIDRGAAAEAVETLFAQSEEDEEENPELANARQLLWGKRRYHWPSSGFLGSTGVTAAMATSIMSSSGSKVVRCCSQSPGTETARASSELERPAHFKIS